MEQPQNKSVFASEEILKIRLALEIFNGEVKYILSFLLLIDQWALHLLPNHFIIKHIC